MRNIFVRYLPVLSVSCILLLAACRSTDVDTGELEGEPVGVVPPTSSALPVGATFDVRLDQTIGTDINDVGDRFSATVINDLMAADGTVAVPAGSRVRGTITGLDDSDRVGDQAAIRLAFDSIETNGEDHDFSADILEAEVEERGERPDVTSPETAVGAGAGVILGTIISGDLLGALVGGALGAGIGSVISLGTGDVEAEIPAGSTMTLRTNQPVDLT